MFFYIQIVCAVVFFASQSYKMLESIEGNNIIAFFGGFLSFVIQLSLAVVVHKKEGSQETRKLVGVYVMWCLFTASFCILFLVRGGLWTHVDTVFSGMMGVGVGVLAIVSWARSLHITHPYIKSGCSIVLKSTPQIALAISIYQQGDGGISGIYVILGHVTMLTRLFQIIHTSWGKWEKNSIALALAEAINWCTWITVTVAFWVCWTRGPSRDRRTFFI